MKIVLPYDDNRSFDLLCELVEKIDFGPRLKDSIEIISKGSFDLKELRSVCEKRGLEGFEEVMDEALNLLLFIELILQDGIITKKEATNVKLLKRIFKIREGDFYNQKIDRVRFILNRQFQKLYADKRLIKKKRF